MVFLILLMKKPHSVNIHTYAQQQDTPAVKFSHSVNILILLIYASSTQQDTLEKKSYCYNYYNIYNSQINCIFDKNNIDLNPKTEWKTLLLFQRPTFNLVTFSRILQIWYLLLSFGKLHKFSSFVSHRFFPEK